MIQLCYNDLGMNKATASRIRNGITIPPKWTRIKIAERLEIDSTIIWEVRDLIPNQIKNSQNGEGSLCS